VHDGQDFADVVTHFVDRDLRCPADDQFSRAIDHAWPPHPRMVAEARNGLSDELALREGGPDAASGDVADEIVEISLGGA